MFKGTKTILWLATLTLAGFGASGWASALWDVSVPHAIGLALVAAIAPLAAAALTSVAVRGAGIASWIAIVIFASMHAGSNANAFWVFEALATKEANVEAAQTHTQAKAARDAAFNALTTLLSDC